MKSNIFYEVVGKNIRKYREIRGYSLQLLGERVGLTKKTIQRYESGDIKIDVNRLGQIAIALDVDVAKLLEGAEAHLGIRTPIKVSGVPLIGTICAGDGLLAEQNIEQYINYPFPNKRQPDFALRVEGDSMIGAGIKDGDILYMKKASWAEYNGQIVAAIVNDCMDGMLKRMKWEEGTPIIRLEPENKDFNDIEVYPNQIIICGVYMGHFRSSE